MVAIDAAREGEAHSLTLLALESKRYWGYDEEFMARCLVELTVHESDLSAGRVYVAREGDKILGFYRLIPLDQSVAELDMLFVDRSSIGDGVGGALWCHALEVARTERCTRVRVTADPFAASFYEHVGATRVGSARSPSTTRSLPVYEFSL